MAQELLIQGRIVFGHPSKPRDKKDVRTKQVLKNPDGSTKQQYVFGVAIDKNTFNQSVWPVLYNEARAAFPNGIPQNFSYKFKDGDGVDTKGQPYNKREGYAGHCVLTISTEGFAPQVFKNENGAWRQLASEEIKCGDFVAVKIIVKYNGAVSPNTPGLYINPNGVALIGYGQEIMSGGQDPDEMFGGMQAQAFAGMSATPIMSNAPLPTAMAPSAPPAAGYPPAAAPTPAYGQPPAVASAQLPPPHHQFVHNATGQPPAAAPAAYPPAAPAAYNPPPPAPVATLGYPPAHAYGQPPVAAPAYPAAPYPGNPAGR